MGSWVEGRNGRRGEGVKEELRRRDGYEMEVGGCEEPCPPGGSVCGPAYLLGWEWEPDN